MTFERRPGDVSLFKNKKKEPSSKAPDYSGPGLDLSGTPIRVAAWKKTDKNGDIWLSCKIEPEHKPDETV